MHGLRWIERLYSPFGVHLCWPSYTRPDDEIGYVTRVYPGIKENGSIFSHPNPWVDHRRDASWAAATGR